MLPLKRAGSSPSARIGSVQQLENKEEASRALRKEILRQAACWKEQKDTGRGWLRFILNSLWNLQGSPSVFYLLKHTHHKVYFRHIDKSVFLMSGPASF